MKTFLLAARGAWRGLGLRKGRTALMMLGVAIGIVTLTLVVAVGKGTQAKVERGIANFGPDAVMVVAGSPQTRGPGDERTTTLVPADLEAIRTQVPGLRVVAPMVTRPEQTVVRGDRNTTTVVFGAPPGYEEAWDWRIDSGDWIDEAAEAGAARVVVLGATVRRELFGDEDPVGQSVRIADQSFRVVGVSAVRGTSPMGMDMDNRVVVPLSTAMRRMFNVTWYQMIRTRVEPGADIEDVTGRISSLLRERHAIGAGDSDDFGIRSAVSLRKQAAQMTGMLRLLLWVVSLVALVAGAVVLANILRISVAERRTEIALRRALGATQAQVMRQFLIEGVVVTLLGGAAGVVAGVLLAYGLSAVTPLPLAVGWEPFALALGASIVVGLVASIVPARRAAAVEIAEALRP